ncbi:metallo-beta-lactamase superfamily protein [Colletotrichum incanum]|uniref:Metallo-beta-lactamase superfamily protein n=1 Tax=Colletotrichum incanum TaxID=1573173 RepID=A0A161VSR9_COLIC|nr:metallo-beta-lactamase superfamily protein [Colletotrichum incanum]OHW94720.1 metallo-beta-lactamase superfamily protein [Colletotrichum incanum]
MSAATAIPKPLPVVFIPESLSTVDVRVMDTSTLIHLNPDLFWRPKIDGFDGLHAPIYCFLISNPRTGRHVLFDLGVRPDWRNYAPKTVELIESTTIVTPGSDVAGMLDADNTVAIRSTDIDAVIWSHNHFDHIGDITRFPSTTRLIVGPGVRAATWPGWPTRPDAIVLDADAEGRVVHEINFDDGSLKIGQFKAFDFFGDGSFYLLDAPGHAVGHICALARTDAAPHPDGQNKSLFIFMGADACHHMGVLRPSLYQPLPPSETLQKVLQDGHESGFCPGLLDAWMTHHSTAPFFEVNAPGPIFPDGPSSFATVQKIQELDALDNVFVIMAHDLSLQNVLPLFPEKINGWAESGIKTDSRWLFCNDFVPHPKPSGD